MRFGRIVAAALIAIVVSVASTTVSNAAPDPYHLNGGVLGRHYWLDPAMINSAYMPLMRNGVSSWNAIGSRISFSEVASQCCDSQADFYAQAYGNTGWRGVTVPRLSDGSAASACVGCVPFTNWDYAEISANDDELKFDCCVNRTQSTIAHEFGHAVGLDHSSIGSALMYAFISRYDTYGTYTPQFNDDGSSASQLQ